MQKGNCRKNPPVTITRKLLCVFVCFAYDIWRFASPSSWLCVLSHGLVWTHYSDYVPFFSPWSVCAIFFPPLFRIAKYLILFDGCECIYSYVFMLSLCLHHWICPCLFITSDKVYKICVYRIVFANVYDLPAGGVHFEKNP